MGVRLSEMFPEPARSWFPPGWLTDTARPAIRTDDQFPLLHAHLRFITGSPLADVGAERGTRAADSGGTVQEKLNAWHLLVAARHYQKNNFGPLFSLHGCVAVVYNSPSSFSLLSQFKDYIKLRGTIACLRGRLSFNLPKYSCLKCFPFRLI